MNGEDVGQYWEAQAEEWDEKDNGRNIANALQTIAADSDHLLLGATTAAALAVARRFCTHETSPPPLPKMTNLGERRAAAKQHPGLCGAHHAQFIGNTACDAVVERARGGLITTKNLRNQTSTDHRFVRSFFMLGKAAFAAVRSVPKVVAIDAGHLKGSWNGVMYIFSMKDSNKIIHVSTVLANKENETNYRFFFDQTCKNDHMKTLLTSGTVTFFTDGHRGSPPALAKVVPMAPVRTCLRHLLTNTQMRKMGTDYSAAVYKAAKMPNKVLFDEAMAPIKKLFPGNYDAFLTSCPLKTWTHHANNSELVLQDSTTSNCAESTIHAVGAQARALNPFHLMATIAEQTVGKLATNADLKKNSSDVLVPFAEKYIENGRMLSLKKTVLHEGLGVYLVQEHGKSMLGNRLKILEMPGANRGDGRLECTSCTPSSWRLPCCDLLAVLRNIDRLDATMAFVNTGYTLAYYREAHSDPRFPGSLPIWSELEKGNLLPPRPMKGQAGAPKKGPQPRA
ncbi:unnamed protein product [Pylaiella littoralis]